MTKYDIGEILYSKKLNQTIKIVNIVNSGYHYKVKSESSSLKYKRKRRTVRYMRFEDLENIFISQKEERSNKFKALLDEI